MADGELPNDKPGQEKEEMAKALREKRYHIGRNRDSSTTISLAVDIPGHVF